MVTTTEVHLRPTTIPVINTINVTSGRYAQSYFVTSDSNNVSGPKPLPQAVTGENTIVLVPGSRFLKIGLAKDAFPKSVPNVIARKTERQTMNVDDEWSLSQEEFKEALSARHKQIKKKPPPNIYTSIQSYNSSVEPQQISAHNDSYAFEWTDTLNQPVICGKEALRLNPDDGYHLCWPIRRGSIAKELYTSFRDAQVDLEHIWRHAMRSVLSITGPLSDYVLMIVVPPFVSRWELRAYTEVALNHLGMKAVTFVQEPVAASFGAGISSACVVDMGAQTTTVACVEEGSVLPESLVKLDYGADDVTKLLLQTLRFHGFPYAANLEDPLDFELINELREKFCTLNEDEVGSLIYEFYVRRPGQTTLHYNFKVLEERIIAVDSMLADGAPWLAAFEQYYRDKHPETSFWTGYYDVDGELADKPVAVQDVDEEVEPVETVDQPAEPVNSDFIFECKWNGCIVEPFTNLQLAVDHLKEAHAAKLDCQWGECAHRSATEVSQVCHLIDHLNEANMTSKTVVDREFTHKEPLDRPVEPKSLIEAILASTKSATRTLSSILLIGGHSQVPHLREALWQRLYAELEATRQPEDPEPLPLIEFVLSKDLDPAFFSWKGGAVASKLDPTQECWIRAEEWHSWGPKLLRERLPF